MSKIVLKIGLIFSILSVIIILTGMSFNSSIENRSIQKLAPDTLKTINNYQVTLLKDETIDVNISDWDYFYSSSSSEYKKGENQSISSNDYNFNFKYSELIKNNNLITPEELNLYSSKSNVYDGPPATKPVLFERGVPTMVTFEIKSPNVVPEV